MYHVCVYVCMYVCMYVGKKGERWAGLSYPLRNVQLHESQAIWESKNEKLGMLKEHEMKKVLCGTGEFINECCTGCSILFQAKEC